MKLKKKQCNHSRFLCQMQLKAGQMVNNVLMAKYFIVVELVDALQSCESKQQNTWSKISKRNLDTGLLFCYVLL